MAKKKSALSVFVGRIKEEAKAEKSPSATLQKLIDDYCLSEKFDKFLVTHKANLLNYITDQTAKRDTKHRASKIGKCLQERAFELAGAPKVKIRSTRPARQFRALYNGTFVHLRYHILFDALHEANIVRTLYAEDLAKNESISLSGTVDRVVEFDYADGVIRAILDFKSIKAYDFEQLIKPQADHAKQQAAYDLLGKYNANVWIMVYENKNTHDLKLYDMPYDELTRYKILREMRDVEKYAEQYVLEVPLAERIDLQLTVTWCRYCAYEPLCLQQHPNLPQLQSGDAIEDDVEEAPVF